MRVKFILIALVLFFTGTTVAAQKLILFTQAEGLGYKNRRGKIVIPAQFLLAGDFSKEGLATVVDNKGWALIDKKGLIVIRTPFIFDGGPDDFAEGLARFTVDDKFGFYDKTGKTIIAPQFDFAQPFHDGLAAVCLGCRKTAADPEGHYSVVGGRWGYINRRGAVVVELRYEEAEDFGRGRGRVKFNNKWSRVDKSGKVFDQ